MKSHVHLFLSSKLDHMVAHIVANLRKIKSMLLRINLRNIVNGTNLIISTLREKYNSWTARCIKDFCQCPKRIWLR